MINLHAPAHRLHAPALLLALAVFSLSPAPAHANAGTPLMWVAFMHLSVGNLAIGIFEGLLIAWVFKIRAWKPIGWMIWANYFSALCGLALIGIFSYWLPLPLLWPNPLPVLLPFIWCIGMVLIVVTYPLEWPFCLLIFRKDPRRLRKSVLATMLVQTASYAILVPLYIGASYPTVLTETKLERGFGFAKNPQASVFYLGEDGAVWRKRLNDQPAERMMDAKATGGADRLYARPDETVKSWDLWLVRANAQPDKNTHEQLLKNFAPRSGRSGFVLRAIEYKESLDPYPEPVTWRNHSFRSDAVTDLRPKNARDWECSVIVWAAGGLRIYHKKKTQGYEYLGFETPVLNLNTRNVTILPGDQAVYQLGDDMIVLLDLNTRQLALVARGRGPAVGLEE